MSSNRRLPLSLVERLERLERDNWRAEVATGAMGGGAAAVMADGVDVQAMSVALADAVARVEELEQRVTELEEGSTSG